MKKRKRKGIRRKDIWWDYNYDGQFRNEIWTKEEKDYWKKWLRRERAKETKEEIANV